MHQEHPDLIRDQYWDNVTFDLPYTEASQHLRVKDPLLGSAMNLKLVDVLVEMFACPMASIVLHGLILLRLMLQ